MKLTKNKRKIKIKLVIKAVCQWDLLSIWLKISLISFSCIHIICFSSSPTCSTRNYAVRTTSIKLSEKTLLKLKNLKIKRKKYRKKRMKSMIKIRISLKKWLLNTEGTIKTQREKTPRIFSLFIIYYLAVSSF